MTPVQFKCTTSLRTFSHFCTLPHFTLNYFELNWTEIFSKLFLITRSEWRVCWRPSGRGGRERGTRWIITKIINDKIKVIKIFLGPAVVPHTTDWAVSQDREPSPACSGDCLLPPGMIVGLSLVHLTLTWAGGTNENLPALFLISQATDHTNKLLNNINVNINILHDDIEINICYQSVTFLWGHQE